nr:MAG TPA: hypothetical protein [Caudoviricetes sp.]
MPKSTVTGITVVLYIGNTLFVLSVYLLNPCFDVIILPLFTSVT